MKTRLSSAIWMLAAGLYVIGDIATFIYLVFFDGTRYTWWNWMFIVPLDFVIAQAWPAYWLLFHRY